MRVEEISEIQNCMYFGRDIGTRVSHLIEILDDVDMPESINIDGDFRIRIPMGYVESGEDLKTFEDFFDWIYTITNCNKLPRNLTAQSPLKL